MNVQISDRLKDINGSAIRDIFKLLGDPNIISFAGGNPASSALEPERIAAFAQEALAENGVNLLQYGQTEGYAPLRESAAEFFLHNGVKTDPGHILPVSGSQQGLDLICKALLNEGDTMLVENPTFLGALQTFRTYGARFAAVETDEDGAIPESLEEQIRAHRPKLIYLIPTFQNPTGRTLSLERRQRIAELVNEYQVPLIEDDPYCDLRYRGKALPAIKSFDEQGYVLYCNSFSKIISPGLRVAAVVCQDDVLLRKLVVGKQSTDVHSPNLNQAIIDKYLRSGLLQEHIRQICASYAKQMDAMQRMLSTFPSSVSYTKPDGGIFLWCTLPEDFNTTQLLSTATKQGVAYIPGTHFYADGQGHHNTMRLNFSNASLENIEKGMERLRALFLTQGLC